MVEYSYIGLGEFTHLKKKNALAIVIVIIIIKVCYHFLNHFKLLID